LKPSKYFLGIFIQDLAYMPSVWDPYNLYGNYIILFVWNLQWLWYLYEGRPQGAPRF